VTLYQEIKLDKIIIFPISGLTGSYEIQFLPRVTYVYI
jgi:hypothetical protein